MGRRRLRHDLALMVEPSVQRNIHMNESLQKKMAAPAGAAISIDLF